jgi:YidC/Oxa1 family membrane protein insertase
MVIDIFSMSGLALLALFILSATVVADFLLEHVMRIKNSVFLRSLLVGILVLGFNAVLHKPEDTPAIVHQEKSVVPQFSNDFFTTVKSELCGEVDEKTLVETGWGSITFDTASAAVTSLKLRRIGQRELTIPFETLSSQEIPHFLFALNGMPLTYWLLVEQNEQQNTIELLYETSVSDEGLVLRKRFIVDKYAHKVDLVVEVVSQRNAKEACLSVFYAEPADIKYGTNSVERCDVRKVDDATIILHNKEGVAQAINKAKLADDYWKRPSLCCFENRYLVNALIKDSDSFTEYCSFVQDADSKVVSAALHKNIKNAGSYTLSFYLGPKTKEALAAVDERLDNLLLGSFWSPLALLTRILLYTTNWLYSLVKNYGIAIFLLTLIIKMVLLPFSVDEDEQERRRSAYNKKIAYIRQKYKDDPQGLLREQGRLLRTDGLGTGQSVIGMLVQFPLIIALGRLFSNSVEIYQAPMLWLSDLSACDAYWLVSVICFVVFMAKALLMMNNKPGELQLFKSLALGLVISIVMSYVTAGFAIYMIASFVFEMVWYIVKQYALSNWLKKSEDVAYD